MSEPDSRLIALAACDEPLSETDKRRIRAEANRVGFKQFWGAVAAKNFGDRLSKALVDDFEQMMGNDNG